MAFTTGSIAASTTELLARFGNRYAIDYELSSGRKWIATQNTTGSAISFRYSDNGTVWTAAATTITPSYTPQQVAALAFHIDSNGKAWLAVPDAYGTVHIHNGIKSGDDWTWTEVATPTVGQYVSNVVIKTHPSIDNSNNTTVHLVIERHWSSTTSSTTYYDEVYCYAGTGYEYDPPNGAHAHTYSACPSSNCPTIGGLYHSHSPSFNGHSHPDGGTSFKASNACSTSSSSTDYKGYVYYYRGVFDSNNAAVSASGPAIITAELEKGNSDQGTLGFDFHHIGDGKTVKNGTPHLFLAYQYGRSVQYLRFRRGAYSSGTWQWSGATQVSTSLGSEGGIDATFNGTDFWMVRDTSNGTNVQVFRRDAASTSTTTETIPTVPGTSPWYVWAIAANDTGVFLTVVESGSPGSIHTLRYNAGTWGAWQSSIVANTKSVINPHGGLAVLHQRTGIEQLIAYELNAGGIGFAYEFFNEPPTAPTIDTPIESSVHDINAELVIDWTFNDPNPGDTQSAYSLRRQINSGTINYWNGTTWQTTEDASTKIATNTTSHTIAPVWGAGGDTHFYSIRTWDAADAGPSTWSTPIGILASSKVNPSITSPADLGTVDDPSYSVEWTALSQSRYRVVVSDTSSLTNMEEGSLEYDSGVVLSTNKSTFASFPTNGVTRYVRVRTWNVDNLASDIDQHQVTVTYAPPTAHTPVVTAQAYYVEISFDNSISSADIMKNKLHRRVVGESGSGIVLRGADNISSGTADPDLVYYDYTVASGVDYEYRIESISDLGISGFSAWVS